MPAIEIISDILCSWASFVILYFSYICLSLESIIYHTAYQVIKLNCKWIPFVTRLKYSSQQTNCYTPASLPTLALIHSLGSCSRQPMRHLAYHHWPIRRKESVVASVTMLMLRLSVGTDCARTDVHFYKLPPWCCNPIWSNVLNNVQTIHINPKNHWLFLDSNWQNSSWSFVVNSLQVVTYQQISSLVCLFYSRLFPLDAQLCSLELVFWGRVCPGDNRWCDYSHSAPCLQSLCCTFADDGIWFWVLTQLKCYLENKDYMRRGWYLLFLLHHVSFVQ